MESKESLPEVFVEETSRLTVLFKEASDSDMANYQSGTYSGLAKAKRNAREKINKLKQG